MNAIGDGTDRRMVISTVWVFYLCNILYADVMNLIGGGTPSGEAAELIETMTSPEMLLVASIFLETAMVMIILSRVLNYGINRWTNIVVALLQTAGLVASLFVGTPAIYYKFFVAVELSALLFIVWYAWTWRVPRNG